MPRYEVYKRADVSKGTKRRYSIHDTLGIEKHEMPLLERVADRRAKKLNDHEDSLRRRAK